MVILLDSAESSVLLVHSAPEHEMKMHLQRDHIIESFRSGRLWVLICTELMGRGLDLRNVNLVINFDLPTSIVSYIHRIGKCYPCFIVFS